MVLQELLALMKLYLPFLGRSLDSIHTAISLAAVHDIIKNTLRQPEKGNRWSTVVFVSAIHSLSQRTASSAVAYSLLDIFNHRSKHAVQLDRISPMTL